MSGARDPSGQSVARRILLLRGANRSAEAEQAVRAHGFEPVSVPVIETVPPTDDTLRIAIAKVNAFDWVVFTSQNGVEGFERELSRTVGQSFGGTFGGKCACVGEATAATFQRVFGRSADLVAEEFVGEGLAKSLLSKIRETARERQEQPARVLLARAKKSRDVIERSLQEAGVVVTIATAYETLRAEVNAPALQKCFAAPIVDAVLFTSSSTATHAVAMLGPDAAKLLAATTVVSIGPVTSETLRELGIRVDVQPATFTVTAALDALAAHGFYSPS